jgi:hypothetical protein
MQNIVDGEAALVRLMTHPLPVKLSYQLSRVMTDAISELERFKNLKLDLAKRHGEEIEPELWQVKEGNFSAFSKDFEELMGLEVEVFGDGIKFESLPDNISISPADIVALTWLFQFQPMTKGVTNNA